MSYRIPVANDHRCPAAWARGAATHGIVNVSGVDEAQAFANADLAGSGQCGGWCSRGVHHLVVGMERGEMHRHVDAQVFADPSAFGSDFRVAVVTSGNQQGGDLQPHIRLVPQVGQGVQDVAQVTDANLAIKVFGECL